MVVWRRARAHLATCERRLQRQQQRGYLPAERSAERQEVRLAVLRATEQTLRRGLSPSTWRTPPIRHPSKPSFAWMPGFSTLGKRRPLDRIRLRGLHPTLQSAGQSQLNCSEMTRVRRLGCT